MFDEVFEKFLEAAKPTIQQWIKQALIQDGRKITEQVWLTYADAAERSGTTYEGIRALVNKGVLPVSKRGGRRFINVADFDEYMNSCKEVKQRVGKAASGRSKSKLKSVA